MPTLARNHLVVAPDLLGHGESDKPRADYSVAAYANGMRDLLSALDIDRVTLVGHSLGGGVAMQFAYQFPDRTERLVLVASGGVGRGVSPVLRAAALPGAQLALAALRLPERGPRSDSPSRCWSGSTPASGSMPWISGGSWSRCRTRPPAPPSSARCARSSTGGDRS